MRLASLASDLLCPVCSTCCAVWHIQPYRETEFIAKKLCPEIILVPVDYHRVGEMSGRVMKICKEYDPNMHIAGCDQGYLKYGSSYLQRGALLTAFCSITPYLEEHDMKPEECVQEMRARIHAETKLTASAGIAPNMVRMPLVCDFGDN